MGYVCFGLMVVLWLGVGVWLLVQNRRRKAEERFDPETGIGILAGSITPLVILFYLLSCMGGPILAYVVQTGSDEGFSPLVAGLVLCFGTFTVVLPLLVLVLKWRERTVIDEGAIQFPLFPFRLVRLDWSEISEMTMAEHKGPSARGTRIVRYITEVSIHAGDRVYRPTWDAATWKRRGKGILRAIATHAHLSEVEPNHWVRDAG